MNEREALAAPHDSVYTEETAKNKNPRFRKKKKNLQVKRWGKNLFIDLIAVPEEEL